MDVAEKERALAEAAILHATPSSDPIKALEQERKESGLRVKFYFCFYFYNKLSLHKTLFRSFLPSTVWIIKVGIWKSENYK